MRTRPAPKDMPLEWEEIFAAWLLLLLGLGLFCRLATWWCVLKKPRRRCAMELELDASLPDAKETPEELLQNLQQREANLSQALNRVRQRALSLRSKLQEQKLEPKVEPQTDSSVLKSPSSVRVPVDDNHTTAAPGAELTLLTVAPMAVRQLSQLSDGFLAVGGSRSPLTSSPDPADDRRQATIASSVAALASLSPPDPANVRRPKLPVSLRVRHVDGTPPELCLACFDCPCACSRTSMRSVRG